MSDWSTLSLHFDPFAALKPPVKTTLQALEVVESILEALLALVKAFLTDLSNPLRSTIALLLAAIRTITSQIKSTGFSILLVHPDFSQPDFAAVLNSASGPYTRFESKVVSKFFDTADIFRPSYPAGSTVAMLVLYMGTESPGDLMTQLFALLSLLRHPIILSGLPAPVNLRVRPINKGGSAVSQFRKLFSSDLDKSLQLEWSMPSAPSGANVPGFLNSSVSFFNAFRFPNFVVERSEFPQGESVQVQIQSATAGPIVDNLSKRFSTPLINGVTTVKETDGTGYQEFAKKIPISDFLGNLSTGVFTGTYRFLDTDPSLVAGKTYFYRVRAYFGNPTTYLSFNGADSIASAKSLGSNDGLKFDPGTNRWILKYGPDVIMGKPSPVVKGFVPRPLPTGAIFDAYQDINNAVMAGLLLNFELPPASSGDNSLQIDQKTGWGTLSIVGGQVGPLKAAYSSSDALKKAFLFKTTARRIANQALLPLRTKPALLDLIASKWIGGAQSATKKVLESNLTWKFIPIIGGFTKDVAPDAASIASTPTAAAGQIQQTPLPNQNLFRTPTQKINAYLAKELNYRIDAPFDGPFPVRKVGSSSSTDSSITVEERQSLADFLQLVLASMSGQTNYLAWYSITVGDLFPAFIPFLNDFEQFILAMLKAVQSALQEIEDIIQTLLHKIQTLEQLLRTITSLLDILSINVKVSALLVGSTSGSASSLAQSLISSTSKPTGKPFGFHSGMVMTFGGPGEGSVAALNALKFLLTLGG